jgi:hypothetical protein
MSVEFLFSMTLLPGHSAAEMVVDMSMGVLGLGLPKTLNPGALGALEWRGMNWGGGED